MCAECVETRAELRGAGESGSGPTPGVTTDSGGDYLLIFRIKSRFTAAEIWTWPLLSCYVAFSLLGPESTLFVSEQIDGTVTDLWFVCKLPALPLMCVCVLCDCLLTETQSLKWWNPSWSLRLPLSRLLLVLEQVEDVLSLSSQTGNPLTQVQLMRSNNHKNQQPPITGSFPGRSHSSSSSAGERGNADPRAAAEDKKLHAAALNI